MKAFIALLCCFFLGATVCLGIPDDSPNAKQQKLYEELGKVILKKLGLKTAPKVTKEQRKNVPQFLIDSYENLIKKSDGKGEERSHNTTLEFDNEGLSMGKRSSSCRKHAMYVDFKKIYGHNHWIIAPSGFSANHCHGDCTATLTKSHNPTNHALMQSLIALIHKDVPDPCCSPSKLSKLTVLYIDDKNEVQLKHMKNMVVEECGCH